VQEVAIAQAVRELDGVGKSQTGSSLKKFFAG
jgi:hypothetical protein